ncbi:thiolase-like protein [Elsinoe ampelina]|uniref:Thiolase-like protein n=1 Tax=Elsinoe ampelina TaxID=302913 RepID=A0A6A6GAU0_9PEZI|nr:thiolase-like protein [Elsinoe ampelina]
MSPHAVDYRTPPSKTPIARPKAYIAGLGSAFPPHTLTTADLEAVAARFHDLSNPGIAHLLHLSTKTGITSRPTVLPPSHPILHSPLPPPLPTLHALHLTHSIPLSTTACLNALSATPFLPADITHLVGATCTTSSCPGIDLHVARTLGLGARVQRVFLQGVGCAGGMSVLRVARDVAAAEEARGRKAVVLVFAVEVCTIAVRKVLGDAEREGRAGVEGALFGDGAGAGVVVNGVVEGEGRGGEEGGGERGGRDGWLEMMEGAMETVEGSEGEMGLVFEEDGFRTTISRNVPRFAAGAVRPLFERLLLEYARHAEMDNMGEDGFDWALHPGGKTILDGVEKEMGLIDGQLRASREVYKTTGNSSSPTVLIVLEKLWKMGGKRDHVVAAAFGPGMMIEMMLLKRRRT